MASLSLLFGRSAGWKLMVVVGASLGLGADAFATGQLGSRLPLKHGLGRSAVPRAVAKHRRFSVGPRMLYVEVCPEEDLDTDGRKVVDIRGIKLVVAKQEEKVFAFNNKCPHLGLSLKRGEITASDDRHGICIVCPYHKSKFSLEEEGKCKVWSESLLGIKGTEALGDAVGGFIAPMAKSVNPEGKKAAPAVTYDAKVKDGKVFVNLPPDLSKYAGGRDVVTYTDADF